MSGLRPAALFRVEGALTPRPAVLAAAWMAANAQRLEERAARLGAVALGAPLAFGLGDPTTGQRLAWAALRGTSEDRLRVLGQDYAESWLFGDLRPAGVDLLEQARRDGCLLVLISDHPDVIAEPLKRHLKADLLVANRLELRNGAATGRLVDPVVARFGGQALRDLAHAHQLDLGRSRAYAAAGADQVLLSAIGLPCAVHPDRALRRVCKDLDWPVVEG